MCSDTRIKADTFNYVDRVKLLGFGICIQLIKIGNTERKICVGKKLYRLGLVKSHEKCIDIFF